MTANQIAYQQSLETARANRVREVETERSNRAGEDVKNRELDESKRHNQATETEANRSNLAKEFENNRHNVRSEELQKYGSELSYAGQVARANASLQGTAMQVGESERYHTGQLAQQKYNTDVSAETARVNKAVETANARQLEQMRQSGQNKRTQAELEVRQNIEGARIGSNIGSGLLNTFTKLLVPIVSH